MQLSGNFNFFKKQNAILRDIVKIFSNPKCYEINPIQQSSQFYLKRFLYPQITKQQFTDISKNIDELSNLPDILSPISSRFVFNLELLQSYYNSPEDQNYILTFIFIISWFCLYDLHLYHDALHCLFPLINNLPEIISTDIKKYCLNESFHHYIQSTKQPIDYSLFFKAISSPDPYFFDLILAEFFTSKDKITSELSLDLIRTSFSNYHDSYLELNFTPLFNDLIPLCKSLNVYALHLFSMILSLKQDYSFTDEINELALIIKQRLKPEILFPDIESHSFPKKGYSDYLYNFDSNDTLPNGFNPLNSALFQSNHSFDSYLKDDNVNLMNICETISAELPQKYANIFIDSIANFVSNKRNDPFYLIFISSCYRLVKLNFSVHLLNSFFNPFIFSSNITLFDKQYELDKKIEPTTYQKSEIAYFVRKKIFDLFLHQNHAGFLLHYFQESPFIFAEIICLINSNLSTIDLDLIITNDTINYIMHVLSLLWYFCNKKNLSTYNDQSNTDTENIEDKDLWKYQSARSTILLFVFTILDNQEIANKCFSSQTFTISFLSRLFEPSLQPTILSSLSNLLMNSKQTEPVINAIQVISAIFDACQEKNQDLASSLLQVIDSAASLNQSTNLFESVLTPVISFLNRFPSLSFLKATLHLLTMISHLSNNFSLTPVQSKLLSSTVRKIEGDDTFDEIISSFLGMIGLSHSINMSSMFIIKNPYVILLLFSILQKREKLEEMLTFFTNLCKHSIYNIRQCHIGELDSLLIEMMKNLPNSFVFRGCYFDSISDVELMKKLGIPLLTSILTIVSSNVVTTKLMQLISVGNALSVEILNQINTSISSLVQYSHHIIPINFSDEPCISVDYIDGQIIDNEYTIQASLMIDNLLSVQNGQKCVLFQILQEDSIKITYYLCNETIIGTIDTNIAYYSFVLNQSIKFCKWFNIVTKFVRVDNETCHVFSMTKYEMPNTFFVQCPHFNATKLKVKIGFTEKEGDDSTHKLIGFPGFIRQISMHSFAFPNDLIRSTLSLDYISEENGENCVFSYPSDFVNETNPNLHYKKQLTTIIKSFLDIITESEIFEFLPLFPPLDEMPSMFPQALLSFIMTILSYSSELQKTFSYFPLISRLLIESNPNRLTYFLYLRFFAFIDKCSDRHIIIELLQHILLNCELWIHAEPSHLMRIVAHWGSTLYSACESLIMEAFSFDSLIALTRIYFWFKPIETDLIRGIDNRSSSFDIELCRKHFDRLLLTIVKSTGYSDKYSTSLISNCASCADSEQVVYYLALLRQICPRGKSEVVKQLFILFKAQKEEIFIETLKALYTISDEDSILDNIVNLLSITNCLYFTPILFDKLIEILPNFPLIYPLIMQAALYLGQEAILSASKFIFEMIPKSLYAQIVKNEFWMIYPLLIAANSYTENSAIIQFISEVIYNSFNDSLNSVIIAINYFKATTLLPFDKVEEEILKELKDLSLHSSNEIKLQLLEVKIQSLLLHYQYCSPSLKQAFAESPFSSKGTERIISKSTSISPSILKNEIGDRQVRQMHSDNILEITQTNPKVKKLSAIENLFNLFINQNIKFHRFHFGLHLNNEQQYQLIMSEISQIVTSEKLTSLSLQSEKKRKSSSELNSDLSLLDSIMIYLFAVRSKHPQNLYDSIHQFYSEVEPALYAQLEKFSLKANLYFNERKTEAFDCLCQFGKSQIGVAFDAIERNNEFIYNSIVYTKKTRLKLERRFGKTIHLNENCLYHHQFRFCSNFTQPKLRHFSKSDVFEYEEIQNRSNLSRKSFFSFIPAIYQASCRMIKIDKSYATNFSLTKDSIILNGFKIIELTSISFILRREIEQRKTGLEIITAKGEDILLDFNPLDSKSIVKTIIKSVKIPESCIVQVSSTSKFFRSKFIDITEKWENGKITNFQYLMIVNIFGGRSFRDASNYPIFPLIAFQDIDESTFSIDNTHLSLFLRSQTSNENFTPSTIAEFLMREEPFTSLYSNIRKEKCVSYFNSFKQMKTELTPEFYYIPEIFLNLNNLDFDSNLSQLQQNNDFQNRQFNVDLPKWCNDPFEFVYILRKALESEAISKNLNLWIDFIFGPQSFEDNSVSPKKIPKKPKDQNCLNQTKSNSVFKSKHPRRKVDMELDYSKLISHKMESFSLSKSHSLATLSKNRICAASFVFNSKVPKVICLMTNGEIKLYSLSIVNCLETSTETQDIDEMHAILKISNATKERSKRLPFELTQHAQFCALDSGLVLIDKGEMHFINDHLNVIQCSSSISDIFNDIPLNTSFLNGDQNMISILNDDGSVYLSKANSPAASSISPSPSFFNSIVLPSMNSLLLFSENQQANISSQSKSSRSINMVKIGRLHCEKAKLAAVSLSFDILAVASIEGNVDIYSCYEATYSCSCNTENEIVEFILITKGFGFIAVFTSASIFLFDINGLLIRKVDNNFHIKTCNCFVDDKGFDFITIVREDGAVFVGEAFYLKFGDPVAYVKDSIAAIEYYRDIHSIVIVTKDKKLLSIPFLTCTK